MFCTLLFLIILGIVNVKFNNFHYGFTEVYSRFSESPARIKIRS